MAATRWSPGPYCRCSVKRIGACLAAAVSTCADGVAVVPGVLSWIGLMLNFELDQCSTRSTWQMPIRSRMRLRKATVQQYEQKNARRMRDNYHACTYFRVSTRDGSVGQLRSIDVRLHIQYTATSTCRYPAQCYIESTCASQKGNAALIQPGRDAAEAQNSI